MFICISCNIFLIICQLLAKSHSLTNARRVSAFLHKEAMHYVANVKPLTNLPDVSIEDLVIVLSTSTSVKATEIFEFIKVAASQQSDPPKSLVDIATQVNDTINLRPSLWVKNDLGVLVTSDVMMANDLFVMACARNDTSAFDEYLAKGQELAAIHSALKYTGLHAAADFGALEIVERLLRTGISANVRDARHGRTALHFAAQSGRCAIASLLLDKGADRTLTDFAGMLPCEVADDQGHAECREILKQVPPEIQYAQVTNCTDKTITLQWAQPVTFPHLHANINEFMVTHEPVDPSNGAGQQYSTKQTSLAVKGLKPSTGHSFVIMSHSLSGWSKPSAKIIHFTRPAPPSTPPAVNLLKVTKNGLLIAWYPPDHENGGSVDLYQIEMTDRNMCDTNYSCTESDDDSLRDGEEFTTVCTEAIDSVRSEDTLSSESVTCRRKGLPRMMHCGSETEPELSDTNKWHRLIKHKDVIKLSKYVMGLDSYRDFYFRCSCRNEFGWSAWSEWIGPFTPQEGVRVRQFGDNWMRIGWVEPVLGNGRVVDKYEVQMCMPTGPMSSKVNVYESKSNRKDAKVTTYDFVTYNDDCEEAEIVVNYLKPGKKYQFRVRPMINKEWVSWDMCVLSDVVAMPSSAPDVPHSVRVMRVMSAAEDKETARSVDGRDESEGNLDTRWTEPEVVVHVADTKNVVDESARYYGSESDSDREGMLRSHRQTIKDSEDCSDSDSDINTHSDLHDDKDGDSVDEKVEVDNGQGQSEDVSEAPGSILSNIDYHFAKLNQELAVTHNTIDIEWVNGVPNGSAIVEMEVQCCKVREYRADDIEKAGKAAGREESWDEIVHGLHAMESLNWTNITEEGKFISAQSFRATNLIPGAGYSFRVRQRNDVHWSAYSRATPIVTTLLAAPPMAPEVVAIRSAHVVAQWRMPVDTTFAFSALQYDVRIASLEVEGLSAGSLLVNSLKAIDDVNKIRWSNADVRDFGVSKSNALDVGYVDKVIIDSLVPMTTYVIKVRTLTVAGWTTWSNVSVPFRTLSLP